MEEDRAILQGAIRKIRTWDNHHWAQPTRDAVLEERRVFVAEVGRKLEPHSMRLKECSFSLLD
jgi:hypothetical protein